MNTREVADQLWGSARSTAPLRPTDIANLGAPPRAIEARMIAYTRRAINSLAPLWLILAILFVASEAVFFVASAPHVPVLALVFVGLTLYSFRWRARERQKVLETLRTGALQRALITEMRAVERRGKYGRVLYVTYHVTFALPSGPVVLVSRDPGLSILQVGLSEEVLWDPRNPDVVVPTYLLV